MCGIFAICCLLIGKKTGWRIDCDISARNHRMPSHALIAQSLLPCSEDFAPPIYPTANLYQAQEQD
jgi:hypothetical protein